MILRRISLTLPATEFPIEVFGPVNYQTRSLCNFLEKHLKKFRIKGEYGAIHIALIKNKYYEPMINSGALDICVPFDLDRYKQFDLDELNAFLNKGPEAKTPRKMREFSETCFPENSFNALPVKDLNEFFIGLLLEGISVAKKNFEVPEPVLLEGIQQFRGNGYKNSWVAKTKTIQNRKYKVYIECELMLSDFYANLEVYHGKKLIFKDRALRTPPDELSFEHLISKSNLEIKEVLPKVVFIDFAGHGYRKDLSEYLD